MKRISKSKLKRPSSPNLPFAINNSPPYSRVAVLTAFVFLLVLAVFYPLTSGDFINYDDDVYVTANIQVQGGLNNGQLLWAFTNFDAANWHPLTWLSHMVDCQLYGLKPWGHHLTSVILHALNAALLFLAMLKLTGAKWRSLAIALLFGLHPLRVESVAWISERKDVLSGFFWMLALWVYAEYAKSTIRWQRVLSYCLTLFFFIMGLMSKPMVVTLPFVLLLLDYWPLERMKAVGWRRLILEKTPFFALAAVGSFITFKAQQGQGAVIDYLPFINRVENAALAYSRYLGKFFYPINLAILYPHPVVWPTGKIIFATILLVVATVAVFALRRTRPYTAMGWLWFLGMMVPVIGLVQVGSQSLADRYSYLPGIGLNIIFIWSVCDLAKRLPQTQKILTAAGAAMVFYVVGFTFHQISYWKDSGTVFNHAIAVTDNSFQAHKALGDFYWSQGRAGDALEMYRQAIEIYPQYEGAHLNRGAVLAQTGNPQKAMEEFTLAIQLNPKDPEAYNDLGAILGDRQPDEAIGLFEKAISLNANYPDAHANLARILDQKSRFEEAVPHYQRALQLNPYADVRHLLAMDLEKLGRKDEAIVEYLNISKFPEHQEQAKRALERLRK